MTCSYIENPKEYTRKLLEPIIEFNKVIGYKMKIENKLCIYTLEMNIPKMKLKTNPSVEVRVQHRECSLFTDWKTR